MTTTRLTDQQALSVARLFREISTKIGKYRFANYQQLSKAQREKLELLEWRLLIRSSDLIEAAVDTILADADGSLKAIRAVTAEAKRAIKRIEEVKKVIRVAAAAATLAGAVLAQNPSAIIRGVRGLRSAATGG